MMLLVDEKKRPPKKTPRLLRSFAQTRVISKSTDSIVPGMNLYDDGDVDVGAASEDADSVSFSTTTVDFSQPSFKRLPQALLVASEERAGTPETSIPETNFSISLPSKGEFSFRVFSSLFGFSRLLFNPRLV